MDLTRTVVRILLPLSFVLAVLLISQGVIQNLNGFTVADTIEGATQYIPGGPAASQIAIKQLGTNGGGFFNMNSSHPFENFTPLSNLIENWAILIIPFALCFTFGRMVRDRRQGIAVFAIMAIIWFGMSFAAMTFEANGNPRLERLGVTQATTVDQSGGNMEGKEVRFGPAASGFWAASTTGTSNGSVNSMHDSYTPLGGMIPLSHMMLGEVSPGGTGVGIERPADHVDPLGVHRRPHGGPNTGVPRQEDPGHRDEAGDPLHPRDADRPARLRGRVGADPQRAGFAEQSRATRAVGDPLRLHVGGEQQRVGLRRPHRVDVVV